MRGCVAVLLFLALHVQGEECHKRRFSHDSVVCVCDSSHCDLPGPAPKPGPKSYVLLTSSRDGQRFHTEAHHFTPTPPTDAGILEVAVASPQQTMHGFGSSVTDAAAIMVHRLSPEAQENLIKSYFGPDGIEYDLVRVPIAGTDFSTHPYSYLDDHIDISKFQLSSEDIEHKLPLLLRAQELSRRPIGVLASPWSPPAWMKTNRKLNESGELLESMWNPWSEYIVRFIKEYETAGVRVWGITSQNHAFSTSEIIKWNSCVWRPEAMRDWVGNSLGPALRGAGLGRVEIFVGDENRRALPMFRDVILGDAKASEYVSGIAIHWYTDVDYPDSPELTHTHLLYPNKYLLYTEACVVQGMDDLRDSVALGSWLRGELYARNIIQTVNQHVTGWVDWNLALDTTGGPNWAGNTVDAPIIINPEKDEFYKQPMFYAMGHFSKFVPAGSVAVPSWVRDGGRERLHTAAFLHPEGHLVVVILNMDEAAVKVSHKTDFGAYASFTVPGRAIQTLLLPLDSTRTHPAAMYTKKTQEGCAGDGE